MHLHAYMHTVTHSSYMSKYIIAGGTVPPQHRAAVTCTDSKCFKRCKSDGQMMAWTDSGPDRQRRPTHTLAKDSYK